METFTNLYSLSKTLRFELRPIGRTRENIERNGLLEQDEQRADSYIEVKRIIDDYHRAFIAEILSRFVFKEDSLIEFYDSYISKSDNLDAIKDKLREQISDAFKGSNKYKNLFKKELIKNDLVEFVGDDPNRLYLVNQFKAWTTYFTGFHQNRENIYAKEKQSTAIAYRLIHDNLPKFIDNLIAFKKIAESAVNEQLSALFDEFKDELTVSSIYEIFTLDYFNQVLTQSQIDLYNAIIGGKSTESGEKIKGINEYVNLYNQQTKDKSERLPKLKPLFKQILSDRESHSWIVDKFSSDNAALEAVRLVYQELNESLFDDLQNLLGGLSDYDLNRIYLDSDEISTISQVIYNAWDYIKRAYIIILEASNPRKKKESEEKYNERIDKIWKAIKSVSIQDLGDDISREIAKHFTSSVPEFVTRIHNAYHSVEDLLNTTYPETDNLVQDKDSVEKIKTLLDAMMDLYHFIAPLQGSGDEADKEENFYGVFTPLCDRLQQVIMLYNKVRNYLTRKPYSTEKIKLNFENSTLLNGWDLNKETDNTTIILRKDGLYFLAIMAQKHKDVFKVKNIPASKDGEDCYEKMVYKQIPISTGVGGFVRKCFNTAKATGWVCPERCLNADGKIIIKDSEVNDNLIELIDCYKDFLDRYEKDGFKYKDYHFQFKESNDYKTLSDFFEDIENQRYKVWFYNVPVSYVDELVEADKIYLFQIYNKDFSPHSKGTPNLHTLYWKMLFDEHNLANVVYKLNGEAEIFYRKASIAPDKQICHPANQAIDNKNELSSKRQSTFAYDLIKDKRYTVEKFQFHVPITLNFKSDNISNINPLVNEYIAQSDDLHIIGIDRGERHLLYLTVIDMKGQIKEQYSLNEIINTHKGVEYRTDYHKALETREAERDKARKSWLTIDAIKDLKEGYLSQVVHMIAELMIKYNAIVVLEDLNFGFKRSRQKFEKSVYQKFEKMLIDKLNYLVDKKKSPADFGGLLKAYQLTNKFKSFQDIGKQCGFLFYVPAWNTSKIDPVTGFVNLFDTRYETRDKAKTFFGKFDAIRYNHDKDWFEFQFDYARFTSKAEGSRTNWTLCTYGNRIETYRDNTQNSNWVSREIVLTDKFKEFFATYNIDINEDLKDAIARQDSADFFKGLLSLLKLVLQMRNSQSGTDIDYMQSPVADNNGIFYNSNQCDDSLPKNADANGAYNIARKGLWIVRKIKESEDLQNIKLAISNGEWLQFAQTKPFLDE